MLLITSNTCISGIYYFDLSPTLSAVFRFKSNSSHPSRMTRTIELRFIVSIVPDCALHLFIVLFFSKSERSKRVLYSGRPRVSDIRRTNSITPAEPSSDRGQQSKTAIAGNNRIPSCRRPILPGSIVYI